MVVRNRDEWNRVARNTMELIFMYQPIEFYHFVVCFYENGIVCFKSEFKTADEAYKEYKKTIEYLEHNLPKHEVRYVARYNGNDLMTIEKVIRKF